MILENKQPLVRRSPHWPRVSRAHLAQHPTCAACGSRENLVAHHKTPVHVDPTLELEPDNLVTLCEGDGMNCHLTFGHLGHWWSWNKNVARDAARFLARVLLRPWPERRPPAAPAAKAA